MMSEDRKEIGGVEPGATVNPKCHTSNFQITRTANNNSIHLFAQQFGSQAIASS